MLKSIHSTVTGGIFRKRMDLNKDYLLELDSQCLLQNFYLEACIVKPGLQNFKDPCTVKMHWGWESPTCQLRGHFLGHYLSAASKLVASENDMNLKRKIDYIVSELALCQKKNGGEWVGSIPEKYFDLMSGDDYIWSPQYTMHKTVMGLVDAYRYANNEQALEIVDHLADWYLRWIKKAGDGVYKGEQGGMLEEWAILYELTGKEKYKLLIDAYRNSYLYDALDNGIDALTDYHSNASIPYSHGSSKMYEITNESMWKEKTEKFWDFAVTNRGMYSTTGQNSGEFWIPPYSQLEYLGDRNQEFCTVYNMVRTADYLYRFTGDTKYLDYIERALYNGFLAQQNPNTGMTSYFLPLGMGSKKKWCSKHNDFWCCHGTMIQAQALYPELIAYLDNINKSVIIAQYIPSKSDLRLDYSNITININSNMESGGPVLFSEHSDYERSMWSFSIEINVDNPITFTLAFRIPKWASEYYFELNNVKYDFTNENGYVYINKEWNNDKITLKFHSSLYEESLPNAKELSAILDGPVVLAGLVDKDCGLVGNLDEVLTRVSEHLYDYVPWKQNSFITRGQETNFKLVPIYEIDDETYTVYFSRKNDKKRKQ